MNVLLFGAGKACSQYINEIRMDFPPSINIIGSTVSGYTVYSPQYSKECDFDKLVIAVYSPRDICDILSQVEKMDIPLGKIEVYTWQKNLYDEISDKRVCWLREYAAYVYSCGIYGNIAECGVYMGHFAYYINKYFYDRTFYIFDTFSGFNGNDIDIENSCNNPRFSDSIFTASETFSDADPRLVLYHMPHRELCVIKQGCFPETAKGLEDTFCFVNLDMDLYKPTFDGLNYFYDKMVQGGEILIHDYFVPELQGVAAAVEDFEKHINKKMHKTAYRRFGQYRFDKALKDKVQLRKP